MGAELSKNTGFAAAIDRWVMQALAAGAASFATLLCGLPGVDPRAVVESLRRLRISGDLGGEVAERMLAESERVQILPVISPGQRALPVPHPLDFEWRFARAAADRLLDECRRAEDATDQVLLLGAPSLIPRAHQRGDPIRLLLLDSNPEMVAFLRETYPAVKAITWDVLRDPPPAVGTAGVVVSDPPWYPEHLRAFMWTSCRLCRPGGQVLVSLPPIGTRPDINRERNDFFRWTTVLGLKLVRLEAGAMPYVMPLFERNSLASVGIRGVPSEWRRGDLAIFVRVAPLLWIAPSVPLSQTIGLRLQSGEFE